MRYLVLVGFCVATAAIGMTGERDLKAQFVGSWNLISFELHLPSGAVLKPHGEHPVGTHPVPEQWRNVRAADAVPACSVS